MNKTLYLIFICLLLCAGTHLVAQTFDYNRVSGHPRLLMKQGEEQQIRESLKDNLEMQRVYKADCRRSRPAVGLSDVNI